MLLLLLLLLGTKLNPIGARNVISLQFAVITAVLIFLTLWRWFRLKESKVGGSVCMLGGGGGEEGGGAASRQSSNVTCSHLSLARMYCCPQARQVGVVSQFPCACCNSLV
jgi:hypothetical protein